VGVARPAEPAKKTEREENPKSGRLIARSLIELTLPCDTLLACSPPRICRSTAFGWEQWVEIVEWTRFSQLAEITPAMAAIVRAWEVRTGDIDTRARR